MADVGCRIAKTACDRISNELNYLMRFSLKDIQGPFRRESGYPQSRPEIFRQLYDFDAMRFRLFAEKQDDVLAVVYTDGTGRHVRPVQKMEIQGQSSRGMGSWSGKAARGDGEVSGMAQRKRPAESL